MRRMTIARGALLAAALAACGLARGAAVKVLLIDGQNNHDFKSTTPVMKAALEDCGRFTVDLARTGDVAQFHPDFSRYDVVLSNYNGADWPDATRKAFVEFVRSGGGLVVVHAADNSFPKWDEFNDMIGVGGWGGRNEKWGPMLYWKDGKIVRDTSPGSGGTHGARVPFVVTARQPNHPILAGLPREWLHAADELYSRMRGPARNLEVLATAWADPKKGGTGRHEPILMTIRYGKGRVFHSVLGHDTTAMSCAGFIFTLQRGTEWAATGKVTLNEVPWNFPSEDEVRYWLSSSVFAAIAEWDFGQPRTGLMAIEEAIRGAPAAALQEIEEKLLGALAAPGATYGSKLWVLRTLRRIGTARCVAPLSRLLTDEKLSHLARYVLQRISAPEATRALIAALERCQGKLLIGVVGSLGDREGPEVARALAPFVTRGGAALARAAIRSLSRVGGPEAARILGGARVPAALEGERTKALQAVAEGLLAGGEKDAAVGILRELAAKADARPLDRLAAARGLALAEGAGSVPVLLRLLRASEPVLREGAVRLIATTPGAELSGALAARLGELDPAPRARLIDLLAGRGDAVAAPAVRKATSDRDAAVRAAALGALGALGGPDDVGPLLERSLSAAPEGEAAFAALSALGADGVLAALIQRLDLAPKPIRGRALEAIIARHDTAALPSLSALAAGEPDAELRHAAIEGLGELAGIHELGPVVRLLASSPNGEERSLLAAAVRAIAARVDEKDAAGRVLGAALRHASAAATGELLSVLPVLSSDSGLAAARRALSSPDEAVARAAVKALSEWKNPAPVEDLLRLAKKCPIAECRSTALAGYVRLVALPANRPALATVRLLSEALELTRDAGVRRQILERLPRFPCREGLELAQKWSKDAELGETARRVAGTIKGIFLKSGMVATASHNGGETKRAFDNDPGTRWSTNTPMRPGMWFQVDLGLEQKVSRIILDTRESPGDYPRGCEVYVSHDGKSWGEPALKSGPQRPITRLQFPKPVPARFIKIVQTGRTQGLFWSIHEMKIVVE